MQNPVPAWLERAYAHAPTHHTSMVAGCPIHYRRWPAIGRAERRVVLIHGGAASGAWWEHIAPLLVSESSTLCAIDLSGHGDSGHRGKYSLDRWAEEVIAVAHDSTDGTDGGQAVPVSLVGHSMGGLVALAAAHLGSAEIESAVLIESPIRGGNFEGGTARGRDPSAPLHVYPSEADVRSRFRVVPAQYVIPSVHEHLVRTAARRTDAGWVWKFDPRVFADRFPREKVMVDPGCPTLLIHTDEGMIDRPMAREITGLLGPDSISVELADAGHTPFLDQPLATVAALRLFWSVRARNAGPARGA